MTVWKGYTVSARLTRLVAACAAASAAAVVGLVSPALALLWISMGAYPSYAVCDAERADFANTYHTQSCQYRDLSGTVHDGWYFKYAPEF